jgi:hypothetical protein
MCPVWNYVLALSERNMCWICDRISQQTQRLLYLILGTDHCYLTIYADFIGQLVLINIGYQSSLIYTLSTSIYWSVRKCQQSVLFSSHFLHTFTCSLFIMLLQFTWIYIRVLHWTMYLVIYATLELYLRRTSSSIQILQISFSFHAYMEVPVETLVRMWFFINVPHSCQRVITSNVPPRYCRNTTEHYAAFILICLCDWDLQQQVRIGLPKCY